MAAINRKLLLLLLLRMRMRKRQDKYKKHFWIRKIFQERKLKGEYALLVKDLKLFDNEYFFKYFRMDPITFEWLLQQVTPHIANFFIKTWSYWPSRAISATLRYLVTWDAQVTIKNESYDNRTNLIWNMSSDMGCIVKRGIYDSTKFWDWVGKCFMQILWNFKQCLGAIHGKHVVMQAPPRSGSDYFNYEKTYKKT